MTLRLVASVRAVTRRAEAVAGVTNDVLARALEALGWSPERLASEVNRALGPDNRSRWISRTLPYKWRDCGVVPRAPLPAVVCGVLSEALGEPVPAERLWPDRTGAPASWAPADDGRGRGLPGAG
jgi:hypothetical protein